MDSVDILYIATFALTILGYFVLWASQKLPAWLCVARKKWLSIALVLFIAGILCLFSAECMR